MIATLIISIITSKITEILAKEILTSLFFFAIFAKAWISAVSLTKALITLILFEIT